MNRVSLYVNWKNETIHLMLDAPATPADAMKKMGVSLSTKIIMRDGRPIPIDETLNDGDRILLIETVSGG